MKKTRRRKLSPAGLEIMEEIWKKGEATINDVCEAINARRDKKLRRTTIQVQMSRLEDYGWLSHREEGRTFYYSAVKEKRETRKDILEDIRKRVFSGSRAELVRCLLDDEKISQEDLEELRDLIKKHGKD